MSTIDEVHLGMQRKNVKVWWQGKGGMKLGELVPRIRFFRALNRPLKFSLFTVVAMI